MLPPHWKYVLLCAHWSQSQLLLPFQPFRACIQVDEYLTLEDCVGGTPLVRLLRLPGQTSNIILAKLEGNNPAGSVKDR